MASSTFQEFLIKLGFLVDPASSQNFERTITGAAKQINELRLGLIALAVGVEESVRRTTNAFETLYYSSRALGISVRELKDLQAEATGAGLDSKAGLQLAQEANRALRERTAAVQALMPLATKADEVIHTAVQRYHELVKAGGEAQGSPAQLYLKMLNEQLGLTGEMIRQEALFQDRSIAYRDRQREIYSRIYKDAKSVDEAMDRGALNAANMNAEFNLLGETISGLFGALLTNDKVATALQRLSNAFITWATSPEVIDAITDLLNSLAKFFEDPKNVEEFTKSVKEFGAEIVNIVHGLSDLIGFIHKLNNVHMKFPDLPEGMRGTLNPNWIALKSIQGMQWIKRQFGADAPSPDDYSFTPWFPSGKQRRGLQHGGIVDATLHHGEMVLPRQISDGLQQLFMHGPAYGGFPANDNLEVLDDLERWLLADSGFKPFVQLSDEVFEKLRNLFLDFWDEKTQAAGGGPGGGPGGGAPGAPGGPGVGPDGKPLQGPDQAAQGALSQKAAELISRAEGTFGPGGINYNKVYGGGTADLTNMTIAQVLEYQKGLLAKTGHSPVGAFQIIAKTLAGASQEMNLDINQTKFSPEIQRLIAGHLLSRYGAGQWHNQHPELMAQVAQMRQSGAAFAAGPAISTPPAGGNERLGGMQYTRGVRKELLETLAAASKSLPEGYRMEITPHGGTTGPHAAGSEHYKGNALDFKIIGPGGKLPNEGAFGQDPGLYRTVAHAWYNETLKRYPQLAKMAEWGAEFETSRGSGRADWMHVDYGGYHRGARHRVAGWHYQDNSTTVINGVASSPYEATKVATELQSRKAGFHSRHFLPRVG